MEKLGVIGGMAPRPRRITTTRWCVIRLLPAIRNISTWWCSPSRPCPDRTLAIKTGEHAKLLATMKECAQALESLGCAHIAIPCNTSHYFYDQIQSFTTVPIIHMPRESVRYALAGAVMGESEFDPNLSMPA